jgi:MFS family permease
MSTTVARPRRPAAHLPAQEPDRYKWVALSNTTIAMLITTINSSIVLIALPDIFRGIHLDPLLPGNTSYLLWMMMGFMVATAVLVVTFGRIGDMFGRVRMFNLGLAVFTACSILLSATWMSGSSAALWLIAMRIGQGVGGALVMGNSSAILTDAFPSQERGLALGVNAVAAIAGSFLGLVLGGLLAPASWRLVFLVSVPFGLFGTVWAYWKLQERSERRPARIDWWGNATFAIGLVLVLVSITYGIQPYGGSSMGWTNPLVLAEMGTGLVLLAIFVVIELRTDDPMFSLGLFRIRAFTAGSIATLLASLGRGGLMFMLIIWLQGIWLPLHGYSFADTPLWAGIYMLPLTVGFLIAGPASGRLSDRFGARPFATGGMVAAALAFLLLELLPVDFAYWAFASLLLLMGLAMGLFSAPNQMGIMNSLPAHRRGVGAGMAATFQNSAMVLSIGIFFSLMIVGLSSSLPGAMSHGLVAQGVPAADATRIAHLPAVGVLFASFLGYNPMQHLLGPTLHQIPASNAAYLTGPTFFPGLIAQPFANGLHVAFDFAIAACLVAAAASWLRGLHYVHGAEPAMRVSAEARERLPA